MLTPRASRDFWLLALMALLVLGAGLGLRDPWPADEPRFALVARQMVESGDWLFPHRGSELYSDKPPLLMWLQGGFYLLLGNWRLAFLLPSLLAALGTLACVYDLGRRLWTRQVGLYAAWTLLFTLHFTFQAKRAQIDPLVVFLITLANYGLLRHLLSGPAWRWWVIGWAAAGLGMIAKGVGVLGLLMLVPALVAQWRGWPRVRIPVRDARFWLGPLAFAGVVSAWLLPLVTVALASPLAEYRAYLHDLLLRQTAGRYLASWDHPQPAWYHFGVMAVMWLPPFLALPWALPAWRRRLQRRDPRYLLPLAWWGLVLVFFSIPHGKRDVYILPALPMFCLTLAPLLPGLLRKPAFRALLYGFSLLLVAALGLAAAWMLEGPPRYGEALMTSRGIDGATFRALAWLVAAMGAWGAASVLWFGRRRPVAVLVSVLAAIWVISSLGGYPLLNDSGSARGLMRTAGARIGPQAELGLVGWKEQNLLMADRPAVTFGFNVAWDEQLRRAVAWQARRPQQRWLLVQEPALYGCVDRAQAQMLRGSHRRRWWLVPASAVHGACPVIAQERMSGGVEQGPEMTAGRGFR
ncbi:glycosyltransferase family 39 protein [Stenotrophomonas sp. YIM B06876]|uniref:ArnT family glycosyltransferase n=1 Tax=Stenotrophomonas sp. YIM B06876 TaxID=3060211 RepID=UPI0027395EE9|nr:glycosyltransferase family 39 protein [Stenotrophomonas sp. YIM B06876]